MCQKRVSLSLNLNLLWFGLATLVVLAFAGLLSALSSLPTSDLALYQQLDRELGALCQAPPSQAVRVCQLHARLVSG